MSDSQDPKHVHTLAITTGLRLRVYIRLTNPYGGGAPKSVRQRTYHSTRKSSAKVIIDQISSKNLQEASENRNSPNIMARVSAKALSRLKSETAL